MFKALDPLNHRWDKHTVCVGYWQDEYQKYKLFKVKTKNNKTRLFAILDNRLCEFDLNTGKMTPITHFYGKSGWDPMSFSCVLRAKWGRDCRNNDLVFTSVYDNDINFKDFKNGRIRSNGCLLYTSDAADD